MYGHIHCVTYECKTYMIKFSFMLFSVITREICDSILGILNIYFPILAVTDIVDMEKSLFSNMTFVLSTLL